MVIRAPFLINFAFISDCPDLPLSTETNDMSSDMYKMSFRSKVLLTCQSGYSFVQEEFSLQSSVTIECEKGGKWNVSRIPNCMSKFSLGQSKYMFMFNC